MATLRWVLCPHCGTSLNKPGTPALARKSIGPTVLETCPHCLKQYSTGFSEWERKSKIERFFIRARTVLSSLAIGFFMNVVIFFASIPILSKLNLSNREYLVCLGFIFLTIFIISFFKHWKGLNEAIAESLERTKKKI